MIDSWHWDAVRRRSDNHSWMTPAKSGWLICSGRRRRRRIFDNSLTSRHRRIAAWLPASLRRSANNSAAAAAAASDRCQWCTCATSQNATWQSRVHSLTTHATPGRVATTDKLRVPRVSCVATRVDRCICNQTTAADGRIDVLFETAACTWVGASLVRR